MGKLKHILICILFIVIAYSLFIFFEVYRFNTQLGVKPLITVGNIDVDIEAGNNLQHEKIKSLGFVVEYNYIKQRENNSDIQILRVVNGKFKIFNNIILSSWNE